LLCRQGFCTLADGECRMRSDEDCRRALGCQTEGRCAFIEGTCQAASDADCAASERCAREGRCSVGQGSCQAPRDEECRRSSECESLGYCSVDHGECKAFSEADCKRSSTLAGLGRWQVHGGNFELSEEGCRGSAGCRAEGKCSLTPHGLRPPERRGLPVERGVPGTRALRVEPGPGARVHRDRPRLPGLPRLQDLRGLLPDRGHLRGPGQPPQAAACPPDPAATEAAHGRQLRLSLPRGRVLHPERGGRVRAQRIGRRVLTLKGPRPTRERRRRRLSRGYPV
jgi:hypothetical protein